MTTISTLPSATHPPHGPAAAALVERIVAGLPPALVRLWRESGRGTVIVSSESHPRYERGHFFWRHVQGVGALHLPPEPTTESLWEVVAPWLDHFAGSFGLGERLSDGVGATPRLAQAAQRYHEIVALGYAAPTLKSAEPALLLVRAVALWRCDPQQLSSIDPVLAKWLRGTLFDEGTWRAVAREREGR